MNPVDEYFMAKQAMQKVADDDKGGKGGGVGGWKQGLQQAAIHGGVGLALAGAPILASKVYHAAVKNSRYNNMLSANEDLQSLRDKPEEQGGMGRKKFDMAFHSLHNMAPEFAADPLVAGHYMRQIANSPTEGIGGQLISARSQYLQNGGRDPARFSQSLAGMASPIASNLAATAMKPPPKPKTEP